MISVNVLGEFRPQARCKNGKDITLEILQRAIQNTAEKYEIPVAFYPDQVKTGGFLNSTTEDCFVLYHPAHKTDYYNMVIRVKHQGTYAYIDVNLYGKSKLLGHEANKQGIKDTWRDDKSGDGKMAVSLLKGAFSAMSAVAKGGKPALEDEKRWYGMLEDVLDELDV